MANNNATTGTDNITQTGGDDTLTITNSNQLNANDFFNGGGGNDTIVISGLTGLAADLSVVTTSATSGFHNYEAPVVQQYIRHFQRNAQAPPSSAPV